MTSYQQIQHAQATSVLDPESTSVVLALLKKINLELGLTIVVIEKGDFVESGQVWSVFSNPQQAITQELLNLEQRDLPFKVYDELNERVTHRVVKLKYATETKFSPDLADVLNQFEQFVHLYPYIYIRAFISKSCKYHSKSFGRDTHRDCARSQH